MKTSLSAPHAAAGHLGRWRWIGAFALLGAVAVSAQSGPPAPAAVPPLEVQAELGTARLQGEARLRFFGLRVYDARLWSKSEVTADNWSSQPLAIELAYARSLDGDDIAQRSLDEMGRQPGFDSAAAAAWLARMNTLFPDVRNGDRMTGVQRPGEAMRFFFNGRLAGEVKDPVFTRLFTGIWLGPDSSQPEMRQQLLGLPR